MTSIQRRLRIVGLCVGLALVPAMAVAAAAGDSKATYDSATRATLQGIITKQLEALGREDGATAESFAAPQLRVRFPDPADFLKMVKEHYAPLLKPRSTLFGDLSDSPHGPLMKMTVIAADGTVWTAVYAFEQIDGAWRITGCGLVKQDSQDI